MITVGALRTAGLPLKELPRWLVLTTQIILGGYLGTTFTPEMVVTLKALLLPIIFFSIFVVGNGIIIGLLFHHFLKWDLATSLLATAAGGVTLMTLTAMEIGADPVRVSIMHALASAKSTNNYAYINSTYYLLIILLVICYNFFSSAIFNL